MALEVSVKETDAELARMQELLDRSYERAGPQLRDITTPERRLSATQVAKLMGDRQKQFAMATVTADGQPRVAPIDGILLKGRFYVYTDERSIRAGHLRRRPGISLTCFDGDDWSVVVHGRAELINKTNPAFAELEAELQRIYESSINDWSPNPVFIAVEAERMFSHAMNVQDFPG